MKDILKKVVILDNLSGAMIERIELKDAKIKEIIIRV